MKPQEPYRDEREGLYAENDRLRSELVTLRHGRRRRGVLAVTGVGLAALDVLALWRLPAMINAPRDASVWGAFALGALLVLVHILYVQRLVRRGE